MGKRPFTDPKLNQALGNLVWALTSELRPLSETEIQAIANVVFESSMVARLRMDNCLDIRRSAEEFLKKSGQTETKG